MFFKILNVKLLEELSKVQNKIKMQNTNIQPKGEYLITYSIKSSEPIKLILIKINGKNYSVLYKIKTNEYFILQMRFNAKVYENIVELYGDLINNSICIYAAHFYGLNYENNTVLENLEILDQY